MDQLPTLPSPSPLLPPTPHRSWVGATAITAGALVFIGLLLTLGWLYLKPAVTPPPAPAPALSESDVLNQQFNQNQLEAAIETTSALLAQNPNDIQALLFQAATLAQRGSIEFKEIEFGEQAIEIAKRVLALDPTNAEAYRIIGYANEIMRRYDEAAAAYNQALVLAPANAAVLNNRGHTYDLKGDFELAKADYQAAIAADAAYLPAVQNLARVHLRENNYAAAKESFTRVAQKTDSIRLKAEAENNLSTIVLYLDNNEDASLALAQQAAATDPALPHAYVAQARVLISQQRWDEAAAALTKALEIYPNLTAAYEWLGMGYMKLGSFEEAKTAFANGRLAAEKDIHLMNNERVSTQARFDYYLATAHAALDQPDQAIERLRTAMTSPSFDIITVGLMSETIRHKKDGLFTNLVGKPAYEELAAAVSGEPVTPPPPVGQQSQAAHAVLIRAANAQGGTVIQYFPHGPGNWADITYGNFLKMYVNGQITFDQLFQMCQRFTLSISGGTIGCSLVRYASGEITIGCWNAVAARYIPNPPPAIYQCNNSQDDADPEDAVADAADPGCHVDGNANNPISYLPTDNDETDPPQCSDTRDNDIDGKIDAADAGCHTDANPANAASYDPNDLDETNTHCSDGKDNDTDARTDSADPGCHTDRNATNVDSYQPSLTTETDPACSDNKDNDGDGKIDQNDPGCRTKPSDPTTYNPNKGSELDPGVSPGPIQETE